MCMCVCPQTCAYLIIFTCNYSPSSQHKCCEAAGCAPHGQERGVPDLRGFRLKGFLTSSAREQPHFPAHV